MDNGYVTRLEHRLGIGGKAAIEQSLAEIGRIMSGQGVNVMLLKKAKMMGEEMIDE